MRPTVIFDFDGTLALGNGPIEAYARSVADAAGEPAILQASLEELARFDAGQSEAIDGYDAVRTVAIRLGADDEALSKGYVASRHALATEEGPISAPEGLGAFLDRLAAHATLVLVTNSPDIRISEALEVLGAASISRRVCSARKPAGLAAEIDATLPGGPVLSVGDIYVNDLEPAIQRGAATALVGATWETHRDDVTMAAATLPELYSQIEAWASSQSPSHDVPSGTGTTQERQQ